MTRPFTHRSSASGPPVADCPFCDPATIEGCDVWCHTPTILTFVPLDPVVPGHRLFVPERHAADAATYTGLTGKVASAAAEYAAELRNRPNGPTSFNLITSAGVPATQSVPHLHWHYVPAGPETA